MSLTELFQIAEVYDPRTQEAKRIHVTCIVADIAQQP